MIKVCARLEKQKKIHIPSARCRSVVDTSLNNKIILFSDTCVENLNVHHNKPTGSIVHLTVDWDTEESEKMNFFAPGLVKILSHSCILRIIF